MYLRGQLGNLGEPIVSLRVRRKTEGNTGDTQRSQTVSTEIRGKQTRYLGTSESEGTRVGRLAVVAEHSTEGWAMDAWSGRWGTEAQGTH